MMGDMATLPHLVFAALSFSPLALAQEVDGEKRGLVLRAEGAFQGYTLFSPLNSKTAYLVDLNGEVVHRWETSHPPGEWLYLLDDGHLLRTARLEGNPRFHGGGIGGGLQEIDWDGKVLWEFTLADDYQTTHHDIDPLPSGNVLVTVWEHRFREDALEWGRDPGHVGEAGMWPDAVLEIEPTRPKGGAIVWEWHAWDHLVQDLDPERANHGSIPDHPELVDINADHRDKPPMSEEELQRLAEIEEQMRALGYAGGSGPASDTSVASAPRDPNAVDSDWLHTNSVDYLPEHDLIVINTPNLGEFWVIDHSTTAEEAAWHSGGRWKKGGDILYRWGNPKNYGAGAQADRRFFGQHDVRWLPSERPGELRVLVFNNGQGRPEGEYSSVDELVLPFDPKQGFVRETGRAFDPPEPVWSYSAPPEFYSPFISGAERLPNGNTLVCSGVQGRIFEVTREGRIVWDYLNPFGGDVKSSPQSGNSPPTALFRATRIAKGHPGLAKHGL